MSFFNIRRVPTIPCDSDIEIYELSFTLEFSVNGAELSLNSVNSGNLINHGSINWA